MNRPAQLALPKPGPGLKAVLLVLFVIGAAQSVASDSPLALRALDLLSCDPQRVAHGQVWRLLTGGVITDPRSIGPLLFTLMGLYFFATELETLWGTARFIRFLLASTVLSNTIAVAVDLTAPGSVGFLHPFAPLVGSYAMTTAAIIAWSRINARTSVRLFYLVPMTGRTIFWLTVAACAWCLYSPGSEGPVAPLGGVLSGIVLTGHPSPLRRAYLKLKLAYLQQRAGGRTPTAHEIAFGRPAPKAAAALGKAAAALGKRPRTGGPPLRLVPGGRDERDERDDDRGKPKDKRYLN